MTTAVWIGDDARDQPGRPVTSGFEAAVAALTAAPVAAAITAADERGTVLWVNEAFARLSGLASGRMVGGDLTLLEGPETEQDALARIRGAVDRGQTAETVLVAYRPGGQAFALHARAAPLAAGVGEPERRLWFFRDVTDDGPGAGPDRDLARENETLSRILSTVDDHVYEIELLGPGDARVVYSGPNWEKLLGGHPGGAPVTTRIWDEHVHPDDRAAYDALDELLLAGKRCEVEYRLVGADGVTRWMWERMVPRRDADGRVFVDGVVSDVTQRRVLRIDLDEARAHLDRIDDSIDEVLYTIAHRPEQGWTGTYASRRWERLFGGPQPELADLVTAWQAAAHPDDRAYLDAGRERLLQGEATEQEYRILGADGVERWVLDRAKPRPDPDGGVRVDGILIDISPQRRASEALAEANARLSRIADAIDVYIYTDGLLPDGRRGESIYASPGFERLLGRPVGDAREISSMWAQAVHPDDRAVVRDSLERLLRMEPAEAEYRIVQPDGGVVWVWDRGRPRRLPNGQMVVDGVIADVTDRRRVADELAAARDEAERRSLIDPLTGAFNRRHFTDVLDEAVRRAPEGGRTPGVVMLDADRFKHVNDIYGHHAGDELLIELVARLAANVREGDFVARWGGEEFAVLIQDVPDEHTLRRIAEGLRRSVTERPFRVRGEPYALTVSVGAARLDADDATPDALTDAADQALLAAKRRGRNQVVLLFDLSADDLVADEPDVVRLAQALAFEASVREAMPEEHPREVAELSAAVAERMSGSATLSLRCRLGGWLHDVGTVAVPDAVLRKAAPLTADEWRVMESHATQGERIVERIPGLSDVASVVRHHHERYDGSGYPDGLAGDEIPLESRIVAAADAYSAMTRDRFHAPRRDPVEAIEELRRSAGTQLDPEVVDAVRAELVDREHRRLRRMPSWEDRVNNV